MPGTLELVSVVAVAYFATLNLSHLIFTGLAWRSITGHLRKRSFDGVAEALSSPLTPGVSVLVPAYNEEAGIVESVRSLLALRYPEHEVVVVNDGSADGTLAALAQAFELSPVRRAMRTCLSHEPVRQAYVSRRHPNLWVLDKENGGKADALNAGLSAAHYPYVCAIDADAVIEDDALLRVAKPILDDPGLVAATGGIVRIANGCTIDHGQVLEVGLPKSRLAALQVVEYFRAFLVGRVAWSRLNSLLIISGAFGLFHRETVETVGGYARATVGEDIELVVRLHRHLRGRGEPYRIAFVPDPVCWTESPEDFRTLSRQRRRWQRGLGETLWRHRALTFNPRYRALGLVAMPYFLLFEFLGAPLQVLSYLVIPAAAALGALSITYLVAFLVVSVLLGTLLSLSALALEEFSFRRHARAGEIARLLVYAVVDNLGYRQLTDVWRVLGLVDLARGRHEWGAMTRKGLVRSEPPARESSTTEDSVTAEAGARVRTE